MYLIERDKNRIAKIQKRSFAELKFKEREHLQVWIANNPECLGEELLIIQKEFRGFSETNERLDLLALDKFGNLVIIENKLDDSGKDVTWQVIKYASYCSTLIKQDILKIFQDYLGSTAIAQEKLSEFFDNRDVSEIPLNQGQTSQRLILVAANFRKEVTSTVLWLLNFKVRLQCIKVTPYALGDQLFLNVEHILPTKDMEELTISMASKAQEEIDVQDSMKNSNSLRLRFWEQFLNACNAKNQLFANSSPSKETWLGKGIGTSGVNINLVISKNYCRCEVYFNRGSKEQNKELFDILFNMKDKIENDFGSTLIWERMDDKVTCRIKHEITGVSYFNESDWDKMISFLIDTTVKMDAAMKEPMKKLNLHLKGR